MATHIARLARERLAGERPRELQGEEKTAYYHEHFEETVESVLSEVDCVMRIIDKNSA